jgi:hypothetical protein
LSKEDSDGELDAFESIVEREDEKKKKCLLEELSPCERLDGMCCYNIVECVHYTYDSLYRGGKGGAGAEKSTILIRPNEKLQNTAS